MTLEEKELSKGFTGIEINGIRFSNVREMLIYMNKQRDNIVELEKENAELKEEIADLQLGISIRVEDMEKLENQIEKMKCCNNCANEDREDFYDDTWYNDVCGNCENQCNWELKEYAE